MLFAGDLPLTERQSCYTVNRISFEKLHD